MAGLAGLGGLFPSGPGTSAALGAGVGANPALAVGSGTPSTTAGGNSFWSDYGQKGMGFLQNFIEQSGKFGSGGGDPFQMFGMGAQNIPPIQFNTNPGTAGLSQTAAAASQAGGFGKGFI